MKCRITKLFDRFRDSPKEVMQSVPEPPKNARYYREYFKDHYYLRLRNHLLSTFEADLLDLLAEARQDSVVQESPYWYLPMILGLLAYGRLAPLEELYVVSVRDDWRHPLRDRPTFQQALRDLLPLPEGMRYWSEPERLVEWISAHRERLRWDEEEGRFILLTGEYGTSTPVDAVE